MFAFKDLSWLSADFLSKVKIVRLHEFERSPETLVKVKRFMFLISNNITCTGFSYCNLPLHIVAPEPNP